MHAGNVVNVVEVDPVCGHFRKAARSADSDVHAPVAVINAFYEQQPANRYCSQPNGSNHMHLSKQPVWKFGDSAVSR